MSFSTSSADAARHRSSSVSRVVDSVSTYSEKTAGVATAEKGTSSAVQNQLPAYARKSSGFVGDIISMRWMTDPREFSLSLHLTATS